MVQSYLVYLQPTRIRCPHRYAPLIQEPDLISIQRHMNKGVGIRQMLLLMTLGN